MLQSFASTGASSLKLSSAILLYRASSGSNAHAHATVNPIAEHEGRMSIQPGRLVTEADLASLVKGLSLSREIGGIQWLDHSVLAHGGGRTIWHTPACSRTMFFDCSEHMRKRFKKAGTAPTPALVWMTYNNLLYCYAVKSAGRPSREDALFQAPFFNVWSNGGVCRGSADFPKPDGDESPEKWVDAFFNSVFSHPNFTQKDRLILGEDPTEFWEGLVSAPPRAFPKKRLVPLPLKLGDLLEPEIGERLRSLKNATGEF